MKRSSGAINGYKIFILASGLFLGAPRCTPEPEESQLKASQAPSPNPDDPSSPQGASYYLGADRPANMLRLILKLTDQGIVVLGRVEAPNTMNRRSPDENRNTFFRILTANGEILLERGFRLETTIRSETNGPQGTIEGHRVDVEQPVFSVAVPLYEDLAVIRFFKTVGDGSRANAELLGEVRP